MSEEQKKSVSKRLIVDIDAHLHREIKALSAQRNISMRLWINRALTRALLSEKGK